MYDTPLTLNPPKSNYWTKEETLRRNTEQESLLPEMVGRMASGTGVCIQVCVYRCGTCMLRPVRDSSRAMASSHAMLSEHGSRYTIILAAGHRKQTVSVVGQRRRESLDHASCGGCGRSTQFFYLSKSKAIPHCRNTLATSKSPALKMLLK